MLLQKIEAKLKVCSIFVVFLFEYLLEKQSVIRNVQFWHTLSSSITHIQLSQHGTATFGHEWELKMFSSLFIFPNMVIYSQTFFSGFWKATSASCSSPLLVLVNSKSGDNQGVKFLRKFKQLLNPAQVFDLMNGGPELGYLCFFFWLLYSAVQKVQYRWFC